MTRLPPLNAVRAFERVARAGSFAQGARDLRVSQGSVSRHVAHLEDVLGVRLFVRGARNIHLTPEGYDFAESIGAALDQIRQATDRITSRATASMVHIQTLPTIAAKWLVPRLGRFRALHPEIELRVTTVDDPALLAASGADFCIHRKQPQLPAPRYDPLFEISLMPVCSPDLTGASLGMSPEALARLPLIDSDARPRDWARWFDVHGLGAPPPAVLHCGSQALAQEAAISGAGVYIAGDAYVGGEIASGQLISPCDRRVRTGDVYHLISLSTARSTLSQKVRDWLIADAEMQRGAAPSTRPQFALAR